MTAEIIPLPARPPAPSDPLLNPVVLFAVQMLMHTVGIDQASGCVRVETEYLALLDDLIEVAKRRMQR